MNAKEEAMNRMLALLVAAAVAGCAWNPAAELEKRRVEVEVEHLVKVKDVLGAGVGGLKTDFKFFLSGKAINEALAQVGTVEIPLQNAEDAVLRIDKVSVAFSNGYPALALDASVSSAKRKVAVAVESRAALFIDASNGTLDNATMRVVIEEIAPRVTIPFYEFEIKGFWKDVLKATAQRSLNDLPSFSVPLAATMPAHFGGAPVTMTIPTGNGSSVTGNLSVPAVGSTVTLELKQALFLEDGIHLFLNAKVI
jgi:hypothetical protein